MKIIIVSPPYCENNGGVIALHKLCHTINELGGEAYLHPYVTEQKLSIKGLLKCTKQKFYNSFCSYHTNEKLNTPFIRRVSSQEKKNAIVMYPEIVDGNPLQIKNVVRWFLHHPGYHSGSISYNTGELYFTYGAFGVDFNLFGSVRVERKLEVTHLFYEFYNMEDITNDRSGTSYCLRKGKGRHISHDLENSILIDGKSHQEIAEIFRKTKYFITYDFHTAYIWFAILCGCIPIIVPHESFSKDDLYPDKSLLLGVAYGFEKEELEVASNEMKLAQEKIASKEYETVSNVEFFLKEVCSYFSK